MKDIIKLIWITFENQMKSLILNFAIIVFFIIYFKSSMKSTEMFIFSMFFMILFIIPYNLVSRMVFYEDKNNILLLLKILPLSKKKISIFRISYVLSIYIIVTLLFAVGILLFRDVFTNSYLINLMILIFIDILTLLLPFVILLLTEYFEIMTVMQIARFIPLVLFVIIFIFNKLIKNVNPEIFNVNNAVLLFAIFFIVDIGLVFWIHFKFINRRKWY